MSIISVRFSVRKTDSAFLSAGLLLTVSADFFLLIWIHEAVGISIFCLAHMMYIIRLTAAHLHSSPKNLRRKKIITRLSFHVIASIICFTVTFIFFDILLALSVLYAILFMQDIILAVYMFAKKTPARTNSVLILTGTILFALCDVNVVLYNLRFFSNTTFAVLVSSTAYFLLWIFYIPSQILLSISGINFNRLAEKSN